MRTRLKADLLQSEEANGYGKRLFSQT